MAQGHHRIPTNILPDCRSLYPALAASPPPCANPSRAVNLVTKLSLGAWERRSIKVFAIPESQSDTGLVPALDRVCDVCTMSCQYHSPSVDCSRVQGPARINVDPTNHVSQYRWNGSTRVPASPTISLTCPMKRNQNLIPSLSQNRNGGPPPPSSPPLPSQLVRPDYRG